MSDLDDRTNDIIKDWLEFREDEINSHPDSNEKNIILALKKFQRIS